MKHAATFFGCLLLLIGGVIVGAGIGNQQASQDYRMMGKFRSGEHVFSCTEEGR